MTHEVRQRIQRPATPEEKERHQQIRQATEAELPELKEWARKTAGSLEEAFRKLEESVALNDPQEVDRLQKILAEMRQRDRELARGTLGR